MIYSFNTIQHNMNGLQRSKITIKKRPNMININARSSESSNDYSSKYIDGIYEDSSRLNLNRLPIKQSNKSEIFREVKPKFKLRINEAKKLTSESSNYSRKRIKLNKRYSNQHENRKYSVFPKEMKLYVKNSKF